MAPLGLIVGLRVSNQLVESFKLPPLFRMNQSPMDVKNKSDSSIWARATYEITRIFPPRYEQRECGSSNSRNEVGEDQKLRLHSLKY